MARYLMVLVMFLMLAGCGRWSYDRVSSVDETSFESAHKADDLESPQAQFARRAATASMGGFGSEFADASPAAPTGTGAGPGSPLAHDRMLTKSGGLTLRVSNVERTQQEAVRIIEGEGGLIINSRIGTINARVPPDRFEAAMERLAELGVVAQRWMNVEDVTEQVADLDLRLGVARESHGRLSDLLARADKVEEMLQVERELRRLTEEIERIEGQRRGIMRRVDASTIQLTIEQLVEVARQPRDTQSFPWISNTGMDGLRVEGGRYAIVDTGWLARWLIGRPFDLGGADRGRLPDGLVPLLATPRTILGTTPEDHRLRARLVTPRQEASVDFWSAALRRSLEGIRGYEVLASGSATVDDPRIAGTRLDTRMRYEGEIWRYTVWVLRKDDDQQIAVVEAAWRESEPGDLEAKATAAVAGMRLR